MVQSFWGKFWQFLVKVIHITALCSSTSTYTYFFFLREIKTHILKNSCMRTFKMGSLIIAPTLKGPKCSSTTTFDTEIVVFLCHRISLWYFYATGYHSLIKGNKLRLHVGFPDGITDKEPAWQGRCKRHGFDPWMGKIPWRRE